MALDKKLFKPVEAAAAPSGGSGNQENGLMMYVDANDEDSFDGAGDASTWYDITNHEYAPATDVSEHFNTVLYTGDGDSNGQSITGVGFQPDLTIIKSRVTVSNGTGGSWMFMDSVRGSSNWNRTDSVMADATSNGLASFDSDGFTTSNDYIYNNQSARNYVSFNFKAGGAPTAPNSGGQTPTSGSKMVDGTAVTDNYPTADIYPTKQSVNTKLGFSITQFEGAGSGKTLPHGLDAFPELYIIKSVDSATNWWTYTVEGGDFQYLQLNGTNAGIDADQYYDRPTAELVEQGQTLNDTSVMYAFTSKRGVSKVGTYIGTGASGNKVYTGFKPAFVMIKATNATDAWYIMDNKRDTSGVNTQYLSPNDSDAETGGTSGFTFTEDGFICEGTGNFHNASGRKFVYLAFAEKKPDSLIDDTDLELHLDPTSYSGSGSTWTADVGNDGTISGATYNEELGDWFSFDGSDDTITISNQSAFHSTNSFTYELWVRKDNTGEDLILKLGSHPTYYLLYNDGVGYWFNDYASGNGGSTRRETRTGSVSDTIGKWTHVCLVHDPSAAPKIYVNGVYMSSMNRSASGGTSGSKDLILGAKHTPGGWSNWDGDIGQVRFYSRTLSADEVMQNYRFTKNDYPNAHNGTLVSSASPSFSTDHFDFVRGSITGGSDQVVFSS
jgi:hypothetical protein